MARNRSEKLRPHIAELIHFALLCEENAFHSNDECDLYNFRVSLSTQATLALQRDHMGGARKFRLQAEHIFGKYGRNPDAPKPQ